MMIKEAAGYKRKSNNFERAGERGRGLIVQVKKKKKQNKPKIRKQNGISKLRCNLKSLLSLTKLCGRSRKQIHAVLTNTVVIHHMISRSFWKTQKKKIQSFSTRWNYFHFLSKTLTKLQIHKISASFGCFIPLVPLGTCWASLSDPEEIFQPDVTQTAVESIPACNCWELSMRYPRDNSR